MVPSSANGVDSSQLSTDATTLASTESTFSSVSLTIPTTVDPILSIQENEIEEKPETTLLEIKPVNPGNKLLVENKRDETKLQMDETKDDSTSESIVTTPTPVTKNLPEVKTFKRNAIHPSYTDSPEEHKMLTALTNSLKKILKIDDDKEKTASVRTGKQVSSGNDIVSGPHPDPFGPVDDLPPVHFPHPAVNGRDEFVPLPTLHREKVSEHFKQKENKRTDGLSAKGKLSEILFLNNSILIIIYL